MVLPNMMEKSEREKLAGMSAYTHTRSFQEGDRVWVKDFHSTSASKWCKGTIKDVLGTLTYNVKLADGHQRMVHLDHPRLRRKSGGSFLPQMRKCQEQVYLGNLRMTQTSNWILVQWGGGGGGVIPSSGEEMPRASTFGQPQNDTDIQLDTSPVREMSEVST